MDMGEPVKRRIAHVMFYLYPIREVLHEPHGFIVLLSWLSFVHFGHVLESDIIAMQRRKGTI
jgi:hypothetical protein